MAIITISRGSYSRGKQIAENVAERLGYECIDRETLIEASEQFNIPETKLVRAIHDAPSILDDFSHGKEKYIAYIQAALVRHVLKDNIVYHGLAGQFLLKGISHVLNVRIISDINDRVALEMEREKISKKEALRILQKDDEQRIKWSKHLYGIDTRDPGLYDIVLHIKKVTVDDAVDIICHTAQLEHFKMTTQSQKAINDLFLVCETRAALVNMKPDVEVHADNGTVFIKTTAHFSQEKHIISDIEKVAKSIPGVSEVRIEVLPPTLYD